MTPGLQHILSSRELVCFVPYDQRILAEKLLSEFADSVKDEDVWYDRKNELYNLFPTNMSRGY